MSQKPAAIALWSWRFSVSHGWHWKRERECAHDNGAQWLATFQADEPGVVFALSQGKPRKAANVESTHAAL